MDTWLTYDPQDFLLFSDRVYWRLFGLHNAALWPAQIPAVGAGLAVVLLLVRRPVWAGRALAAILAVAWALTALTFLPRYAAINWVVGDLIPVFLVQALLLAILGAGVGGGRALEPGSGGIRCWIAGGLALYGVAAYPVIAVLGGRSLAGAEVFALMPDPTAIVTLGAVIASERRRPALILAVVPLVWCLASVATLATLGAAEAWAFAPVGLAILAAACQWSAETRAENAPGKRECG